MSVQEQIIASLEIAAEKCGDINPAVYERYFQKSPGSEELMIQIDHLVRGKMMEEIMRLLMSEDFAGEDEYLTFEMKTHEEAYSVIKSMYGSLLHSVWEILKEGLGDEWTDAFEAAWDNRIQALELAIEHHSPSYAK
jgi:hypothetical protein